MKLLMQMETSISDKNSSKKTRSSKNKSTPKKTKEKQFDLFKRNIIRKYVPGTEEDAKKWQNPKDWAHWSMKRIRDNDMGPYSIWVVFFFQCWTAEIAMNYTLSDHWLLEKATSEKMSFFWKKTCMFPHLEFKVSDISRRTLYGIRQITGFPDYRGRLELIVKWKSQETK